MSLTTKEIASSLKLDIKHVERLAKYLYPNKELLSPDEALVLRDYYYKFGGPGAVIDRISSGIGSIGQLFPFIGRYEERSSPNSGWESVANSFNQTGNNIRQAMNKVSYPQRAEKRNAIKKSNG